MQGRGGAEGLEGSAAQVAQRLRMSRSSTCQCIDRLPSAGYLQDWATPSILCLGLEAVPIRA